MAHTPERPEQFVCTECQSLHAGTAERAEEGYHYHAPATCGACGHSEFVTAANWPHYSAGE